MISKVDINVDLGEGFDNESLIMPFISSANIACGGHAGSNQIMEVCVDLAIKYSVRIGAHPGFEDKANFGRLKLEIPMEQIRSSISRQIKDLITICKSKHTQVSYVKPHGALYHLVCNELEFAQMMLSLLKDEFPQLALMGLPNCLANELAEQFGVPFIKEGFADRVYELDGQLRSRQKENSLINDYDSVLEQVLSLNKGFVIAKKEKVNLDVDSICFHGDHSNAVDLIQNINKDLGQQGFEIGF